MDSLPFLWYSLVLIILVNGVSSTKSQRKVSVSMPDSTILQDQAPYFATFDATPWATWQFANGVTGLNVFEDSKNIPVFDKQSLQKKPSHAESPKTLHAVSSVKSVHTTLSAKHLFGNSDIITEVTPKNVRQFLQRGKAFVIFLLCDCDRDSRVAEHIQEFEKLVSKNPYLSDSLSILWASKAATERFQLRLLFQLNASNFPALVIDNIPVGSNVEKHRFEPLMNSEDSAGVSAPAFISFLDDFLAHRLPLLIRSAPSPDDDHSSTPGAVVDVVSSSFDRLVGDSERDVLLLVYSPRCGGSIAVQPVFTSLARHFKHNSAVRIARMDGTRNDFPHHGMRISHYPSVFLFPVGAKLDKEDSLRHINWDEHNGSKSPHNKGVPHSHFEFEALIKFVDENKDQVSTE